MTTNEILPVNKIGRIDGEWACYCPHSHHILTFAEDDIDEVRGSQYQCQRPYQYVRGSLAKASSKYQMMLAMHAAYSTRVKSNA